MRFDESLIGKNILIVENEWLIADDLRRVLVGEGATVLGPVASVSQALSLISRTPKIDGAVLDIHLGDGSDVYPVAETLRALNIPFVFASGFDSHVIRRDFVGIPQLQKPFLPVAIGAVLAAEASKVRPAARRAPLSHA